MKREGCPSPALLLHLPDGPLVSSADARMFCTFCRLGERTWGVRVGSENLQRLKEQRGNTCEFFLQTGRSTNVWWPDKQVKKMANSQVNMKGNTNKQSGSEITPLRLKKTLDSGLDCITVYATNKVLGTNK